jgi:hypothetical protein
MDTKIIGIILLICAGILFRYNFEDFLEMFSPNEKLKTAIIRDTENSLKQLSQNSKSDIKPVIQHLELRYRSKDAHELLKNHRPSFTTKKDGKIWIEIEILDLPDNDNPGLITQTSVFDTETNNKISEFGQTYFYKDFGADKKKISSKEK